MKPKPIQELKHTSLRYPLHTSLIQVLQTKLDLTPGEPLEVIEDGPGEDAGYVDACIFMSVNTEETRGVEKG